MPEEMKTAETNVAEAAQTDIDAGVGQENDGINDADFSDTGDSDKVTTDADNAPEKKKQDDSANAHRRREAERQAELQRARQAAREAAIIETLGGKNPYTSEDMKDSADVEEYLLMKEIEKKGGDPLSDYSKHLKVKEREQAEKRAKDESAKEWYRKDREAFAEKHPDVDIQNLINDEQFNRYAEGKVGEIPLSDIYEGYTSMLDGIRAEAEKTANQRAQQQLANAKASPGSLASANANDNGFFTREQVQKMSPAEVHKNYDKIRASMTKWN